MTLTSQIAPIDVLEQPAVIGADEFDQPVFAEPVVGIFAMIPADQLAGCPELTAYQVEPGTPANAFADQETAYLSFGSADERAAAIAAAAEACQAREATAAAERALQAAREARWDEVKRIRTRVENGEAPTPFGPADCDDRSKIKLNGIVQMATLAMQLDQPFEDEFTLADNSVLVLSDPMMAIALGQAVALFISAVFAHARDLRTAIDAAANLDALAAIDVEAGWPA